MFNPICVGLLYSLPPPLPDRAILFIFFPKLTLQNLNAYGLIITCYNCWQQEKQGHHYQIIIQKRHIILFSSSVTKENK